MFDDCPSCINDCTFVGVPGAPAPPPTGSKPAIPLPTPSKDAPTPVEAKPGAPTPVEAKPTGEPERELTAPTRASCTAAAITGPATTWVATSAPLMRSDTPPASTSRNGAGGLSVWRARVAAISRRESVELAMAAPLGRSEAGAMVVGMGSSCRGYRAEHPKVSRKVSCRPPFQPRGGVYTPRRGFGPRIHGPVSGGRPHRAPSALALSRAADPAQPCARRRGAVSGGALLARRGLHRGAAHQGPGGRLADPGRADHRQRGRAFPRRATDPLGGLLRSALRAGRAGAARDGPHRAVPRFDGTGAGPRPPQAGPLRAGHADGVRAQPLDGRHWRHRRRGAGR